MERLISVSGFKGYLHTQWFSFPFFFKYLYCERLIIHQENVDWKMKSEFLYTNFSSEFCVWGWGGGASSIIFSINSIFYSTFFNFGGHQERKEVMPYQRRKGANVMVNAPPHPDTRKRIFGGRLPKPASLTRA